MIVGISDGIKITRFFLFVISKGLIDISNGLITLFIQNLIKIS